VLGLLIVTLLGNPNIVKHRELPLIECRKLVPMLTEAGRSHARCIALPSTKSYGHESREPRRGWAGIPQ
jgi:hypothetical protein